MERIQLTFDRTFAEWGIKLPTKALKSRKRGKLSAQGWTIYYIFGESEQGRFMDYLAWHHMAGSPIHKRIYESGEEEALPTYMEGSIFPANATKSDEKRIDQAYYQYNRRVGMLFAMKGFDVPESWAGKENLEFEAQTQKAWDQYFRLIKRMRKEIEKRDAVEH